jgi:U4/U6.U5 tri-snRNP-associated protein 3
MQHAAYSIHFMVLSLYKMGDYDHRRRDRKHYRRYEDDDYQDGAAEDHTGASTTETTTRRSNRDRSRSRSPVESEERKRRQIDAERAARMARLRAENEQEESRMNRSASATAMTDDKTKPTLPSAKEAIIEVKESEIEGLDEEEQMQLLLGFTGGFGTTKNSKVEDNHKTLAAGAAKKNKARKYRQYMNRKGGFNRPLDKIN